ncbi:Lar family restriction alleviation protein [Amorphus sp. MBR-141]
MGEIREWKRWADERPTEAGVYWWRLPEKDYSGLTLRPEWTCEVSSCGMGYADNELWPSFSHWNGYVRTVPANLEWTAAEPGEKGGAHKIHVDTLAPCPFCAKTPRMVGDDRPKEGGFRLYTIPFLPWRFSISCCGRASTGWRAKPAEAIALWNTRPTEDALRAEVERLTAALDSIFSLISYVNIHGVGQQPEPTGEPQPMRVSPIEFWSIFQQIGKLASAALQPKGDGG